MLTNEDLALKLAFAAELFKCEDNPFKAASIIFPDNVGKSLKIATEWPKDKIVIDELARYKLEKVTPYDKEQTRDYVIKSMKNIVESTDDRTTNYDRIQAAKLISEVKGLVIKPDTVVNANNIVTTNKVMIVKDHGTNDEWEKALQKQQEALKDASAVRH